MKKLALAAAALLTTTATPASAATIFDFTYTTNGQSGRAGTNTITVIGQFTGDLVAGTNNYLITGATGTRTSTLALAPFNITGIAGVGTANGNDNLLVLFQGRVDTFYKPTMNGIAFTTDTGPSPVNLFAPLGARAQAGTGQERYSNAAGTAFTSDEFALTITPAVVADVPEPATWAMMLIGFGMVGFGLRHRKANVRTTVSYA